MHLILGASSRRVGTDARNYVLRYRDERHQDAAVLRRLEQILREIGSATPTTVVNADRPSNEDDIIAAMLREPWRN